MQTESRNEKTRHIDKMSTVEMLTVMNQENAIVINAVEREIPRISMAVDYIATALNNGGRLIYIGAGTSGRLGILDASECPPTFGVSPETVIGLIAGGEKAITSAVEGAEDNEEGGRADVLAAAVTGNDIVVGISASGNAPYVLGALKAAQAIGAKTISLTCNPNSALSTLADIAIVTETGPEVITGSTRLKAGTAHKLVLNMLSTGAMVKTGKVYGNYMINVKPINQKLRKRCIRIIQQITGTEETIAEDALDQSSGSIREAISIIEGSSL